MAEKKYSGVRNVGGKPTFFSELSKQEPELEMPDSNRYRENIKKLQNDLKASLEAPFGEAETDNFLSQIKAVESSGGKDLTHKTLEKGMHRGQRAIANFGLMPKTVKDVIKKAHDPKTILGGNLPPDFKDQSLLDLAKSKESDIEQILLDNPQLELKVARLLAKEIGIKQQNDPERMAYSWNMGSNLIKSDIPDSKLKNHNYVNKFKAVQERVPASQFEKQTLKQSADDESRRIMELEGQEKTDLRPLSMSSDVLRKLATAGASGLAKLDELQQGSVIELPSVSGQDPIKLDMSGFMGGIKNIAGKGGKVALKALQVVPESPTVFTKALKEAIESRPQIGKAITPYKKEALRDAKLFLTPDKKAGFGIKDDELINVFSSQKGRGEGLVEQAVEKGAKRLDHFDVDPLNELYKKDFTEVGRSPNYTPGEPDVVFRQKRGKFFTDKPPVAGARKYPEYEITSGGELDIDSLQPLPEGDYSSVSRIESERAEALDRLKQQLKEKERFELLRNAIEAQKRRGIK